MRYFKLEEFESPDEPGTGCMMDPNFLELLDEARDYAGIPMVITRIGIGKGFIHCDADPLKENHIIWTY